MNCITVIIEKSQGVVIISSIIIFIELHQVGLELHVHDLKFEVIPNGLEVIVLSIVDQVFLGLKESLLNGFMVGLQAQSIVQWTTPFTNVGISVHVSVIHGGVVSEEVPKNFPVKLLNDIICGINMA